MDQQLRSFQEKRNMVQVYRDKLIASSSSAQHIRVENLVQQTTALFERYMPNFGSFFLLS
jgi:hypothetical protein